MLRTANEIFGYTLQAEDGQFGQVEDFYFDDQDWTVRYIVADTGGWLTGRRVLITPADIKNPNWAEQLLPVALTKKQIEESPGLDLKKPVSRQAEIDLHDYYGWTPYWAALSHTAFPRPMATPAPYPAVSTAEPATPTEKEAIARQKQEVQDSNLRSMDEVTGYYIQAQDGDIGHVEEFIIDDENWYVMYLVVDTRNWLPGKKVLVALDWVERVDWPNTTVHVDLHKETIKESPEYNSRMPIRREYEEMLYTYYDRAMYW